MIAPQPALDPNPEAQVATQSTWTVDRTGARGSAGAVAAKSPQAAEAAADVLRRGGNAIDAAVVCAFVSGVAEPWMNGIGGGGYMVVHHAATNQTVAIDYPMVSPQGATADMFPLAGSGTDRALFGWPAVVDNANIVGPRATAVPGTVAGLALALERFGTLSLAQALEPAIALAEEGVPVTWHWTFVTVGGGTGGTTSTQALRILAPIPLPAEHNAPGRIHLLAEGFKLAFADRIAYLADPELVEVPLAAMLAANYLAERRHDIDPSRVTPPVAGPKARLGITHGLAGSLPAYGQSGCTTHLSVMDVAGNAVALTQTLLSLWGSRVIVPGTGVLMNNGMMWFDPEPGRPNSVAGGQRPLSNVAPLLLLRDGVARAAIGSRGGRRIMNANTQIALNLIDHEMAIQPAVNAPRFDVSSPVMLVDSRLPVSPRQTLDSLGHRVVASDPGLFFVEFAAPACVERTPGGDFGAGIDPHYFPAAGIGVD